MPFLTRLPLLLALTAIPVFAHPVFAQAPASDVTANHVISRAESQAAAEHKNILITFGASWCGNCRLFERFLADPAIKPIMESKFVFADLDTGEHASDKRHANIPGGEEIQDSLGGHEAGYPYIAITDPHGKPLTNSLRLGKDNIGYPVLPTEIDWFMVMLQKSAPTLTPAETATIRAWLTDYSSKHYPHPKV